MKIDQLVMPEETLEHLGDVLLLLGPDGSILDANPAALACYDYSDTEILALNIRDLRAPRSQYDGDDRLREAAQGGGLLQEQHRRSDGTLFPVEVRSAPVTFERDSALLLVHDVTLRKQVDQAMWQSGGMYAAAFHASPDSITITRLSDGMIVDANDGFERLLGYTRADSLGKTTAELSAYADPATRDAIVSRLRETGELNDFDATLRRKDGICVEVIVSARVLEFKGEECFIAVVRDVTEQRRSEEERRRAERFFRDTFEHAHVGIAHVDSADGTWLRVNQRLCDLLGYTREELMATTFAAITHPDDVEQNMSHLRRMQAGDEDTYAAEKRYLRKDGSIIWVHLNVAAIRKEDGTPDYNVTVVTDISERKQVEEALATSERLSQRVLDTSPNLIYIYDLLENRNLYTNHEVIDFLGYTREDVLAFGSSLFERVLHPEDAALVAGHHARLRKLAPGDDRLLEIDYRMRRADGEWRWLHSRDVPFLRDDSGAVTQILGSTEDTTERESAAERLRESEERYRLLFENANDAVYVHEISDSGAGRFTDANRYASEMLGYSREEFLAMEVPTIDTPEQTLRAPAILAQLAATKNVRFETQHVAKNGDLVPVEISNVLFDLRGTPTVLSVARDITDRRQAENALASSQSRLKAMFEQAPMGVALVDTLTGRICEANPAYARIVGRTVEELRELDWMSLTHPSDVQGGLDNVALMRAGRTNGFQREQRFLRSDGSTVWASVTVAPVLVGDEAHPQHVAMLEDVTASKVVEEELARQTKRIEGALTAVIDVAGSIGEIRDPYTAGHQRRVAELAARIAHDLGMSDPEIADVRVAGLLHDMGKAGVPTEILGKPGIISPTEFELIKGHAESGYRIAVSAHMEEPIPELIYQHHERCDGSGYPRGLLCDQMLAGAKVLAVADVVEAMMSHRPYRPALGMEVALAEIEQGAGRLYDAEASRTCIALFRESGFEFSPQPVAAPQQRTAR